MVRVTRKKTGHLIEITRNDGTTDIGWDWAQLEADVKAACEMYDKNVAVENVKEKPNKVATKKPAAKKAAPKKATSKKSK